MSENTKNTTITIGGRTITLSGNESEEYMQQVAAYLNNKRKSFNDDQGFWKLSEDMRSLMIQLNIADDYMHAVQDAENARKEKEEGFAQLEEQRTQMQQEFELEHKKMLEKLDEERDSQIRQLEEKLAKVKVDKEKQKQNSEQELARVKSQLSTVQEQITNLQKKLYETSQELKKEKDNVRRLSAGHNTELESLREQNTRLTDLNASQTKELDSLHIEKTRLEEENLQNSMALQRLQNDRNRLQNSLKAADAEMARRKQTSEQVSREIDLLRKSYAETEKAVRRLEDIQAKL